MLITVVSGQTQKFETAPITPPDCNWKDLSAYCYSSAPQSYFEHKMVVREPGGQLLEITCTTENPRSACVSLPLNQSFEAWKKKGGLEIRYRDQRGKMRRQVYQIVGTR